MNIEVKFLKEVIDEILATIQKKVNGDMIPCLSKYEAIRELGVISELVYSLLEKTEDANLQREFWAIREEIVTTTQKIMGC